MKREALAFARINNICQLVNLTTRISDRLRDRVHNLDLILTIIPSTTSNINSCFLLGSSERSYFIFHSFFLALQYPTTDTLFGAAIPLTAMIVVTFWSVFLGTTVPLNLMCFYYK